MLSLREYRRQLRLPKPAAYYEWGQYEEYGESQSDGDGAGRRGHRFCG